MSSTLIAKAYDRALVSARRLKSKVVDDDDWVMEALILRDASVISRRIETTVPERKVFRPYAAWEFGSGHYVPSEATEISSESDLVSILALLPLLTVRDLQKVRQEAAKELKRKQETAVDSKTK
jgi:hypothetical protein